MGLYLTNSHLIFHKPEKSLLQFLDAKHFLQKSVVKQSTQSSVSTDLERSLGSMEESCVTGFI